MNPSQWHFELWGGLRARRLDAPDVAPVENFRTNKTASLLAFLAYHRGWHAREPLAEMIWPEAEPKKARNSLRVALSTLRELLLPIEGALEITRVQVRLAPDASTDVEAFRALIAAAKTEDPGERERALEAAVALASGPLLPGFYDDWAAPVIARMEEEFVEALRPLIALHEARGDLMGALDGTRRGAAVAPLREGIMRDIVRLGLACNQDAGARAEFKAWRTRVERLEGDPAPRWEEFVSQHGLAGAGRSAPPTPVPQAPPKTAAPPALLHHPRALPTATASFVGRRAEREAVESWLRDPATRLVTLTGPGGGGKTRLALEIARALAAQTEAAGAPFGAVAWAPLAGLPSPRVVPGTLLDALGTPPEWVTES